MLKLLIQIQKVHSKIKFKSIWQSNPLIPVPASQRQRDACEFKARLFYIVPTMGIY